jgi:uncharacterized phage-like protein YoqJ
MTTIKAREIKVHLRSAKGLHSYSNFVWQFSNGTVMIDDTEKPGYPSYFLSGLEDINKYNTILKNFEYTGKTRLFTPLELAQIVKQATRTYGYDLAHGQSWELIRLARKS